MPRIPKGRRVGRAAVNEVTRILENNDHIVQEIDGQNDFGEDLYATFSKEGEVSGDVIRIQVKGGVSWRRANGYAVPVGSHSNTWMEGNIPVICIVYDPEHEELYWANATEQLRSAITSGQELKHIGISSNSKLNEDTVERFVAEAREYVGRFRGIHAVHTYLSEMSGATFRETDAVLYFVNNSDDVLIFQQGLGEGFATLLHSDLEWEPQTITPDSFTLDSLNINMGFTLLDDSLLGFAEFLWLVACFSETEWLREYRFNSPGFNQEEHDPGEHADIEVEVADKYVMEQILDRLEVEPELLDKSISVFRNTRDIDREILKDLEVMESDPQIVEELINLSRNSQESASYEAWRLAIIYLIDQVRIGAPYLPLEEQIKIVWRVPEQE
ncbi:DUF4365 domain-containing protein [Nocardiopsis halophila]|uniref:DUF4365 domain-containing protein n=1 Tax=Nocardiopsis halophila TaxID=141692 RepID=UPI000A0117B0|nr:DUF4365 domain-containing protein [Nocardiopsis halophila]